MSTPSRPTDRARDLFEPLRDHLRAVAYRMLGTLSDVDDVLQDAFMRFSGADLDTVEHPRAYLTQMVTRLCVDHLRSARVRRETYVGPWLPEPVVEETVSLQDAQPERAASLREDISVALMVALERLSPLERAAFILHDVFDVDYSDIATALGRDPAACRQLAARGRKHVHDARPRFRPSASESLALVQAFSAAAMAGDLEALQAVLAADVSFSSDGGGRVSAATKVVEGSERVAKLITGIVRKHYADQATSLHPAQVNGAPGFVLREAGRVVQAVALDIRGDKIVGIYSVRNPDKLRHLNQVH